MLLGLTGLAIGPFIFGKSAFIGGMIAVLPSYYLARKLAVSYPERPIASLQRIYLGAFIKIVYTLALFGLAIKFLDIQFIIMVSSYFIVTLTNWFGLRFLNLSENSGY
jgi:F0F1-type ATP synthase assembly protein I